MNPMFTISLEFIRKVSTKEPTKVGKRKQH